MKSKDTCSLEEKLWQSYIAWVLWGIGGRRRRGRQRMRWLDGVTDSIDMGLSELREMLMDGEAWRAAIHGVTKSQTWLSDWTELKWTEFISDRIHSKLVLSSNTSGCCVFGQNYFSKFYYGPALLDQNLFSIAEQLLCTIVLASAIQQHESAIGVHTSPPSYTSPPPPPTPPL